MSGLTDGVTQTMAQIVWWGVVRVFVQMIQGKKPFVSLEAWDLIALRRQWEGSGSK